MFKDLRLLFTTLVVLFFTAFNCYLIKTTYDFEHANLVKNLNESLHNAIEVYMKYSMAQKDMHVISPNTSRIKLKNTQENLIRNGNFESGNTLFESEYELLSDSIINFTPNPKGWYWVVAEPGATRGHWTGKGSGNKGLFLVIDGATSKNVVAWSQSMPVKPNTTYHFSLKLSSVATNAKKGEKYHWSLARVHVLMNGKSQGLMMAPEQTKTWLNYTIYWNSDSTNNLTIVLKDENLAGLYNDFGLDDLCLQECMTQTGDFNKATFVTLDNKSHSTSNFPDTSSLRSMIEDELHYRGITKSCSFKLARGFKHSDFFKNNNALHVDSPKYYERYYVLNNHNLSTDLCYLDNRYSVHLWMNDYKWYLWSKNSWFFSGIILITLASYIVLWMVVKNTRKEKQIADFNYQLNNSITHELKTPVATIIAAMDALQNHGLIDNKEKTQQYLEITRKQAQKLNTLIENALTIAIASNKHIQLDFEQVDLNQFILETLQQCTLPDFVTIQNHFYEAPLFVKINKLHFSNILQTIVDNSVKYKKGNTVCIEILTGKTAGGTFISIRDNGIGIDFKYHKLVFEKFYRVSHNDAHAVKGHGLGLSYVKTIADAHHAQVHLESKPNEGTTITITFTHA